jgi:hypothetical protein
MLETIEDYIRELFHLPELAIRAQWKQIFNEMTVHTRKRKPTEILLKTRPNEESHVATYRENNYEAVTYAPIMKAFDTINRLLNEINYTIVADQNVMEYLAKKQFSKVTFKEFIQKFALKRDIEDPNGFLVCMPSGQGLTDSSVKVQPQIYLLYSDNLVYMDEKVYIFLSDEVNFYRNPGEDKLQPGVVYWIIDKEEIWKMKQVGPDKLKDYEATPFYKHGMGDFPVIQLGGDPNEENCFDSFFGIFNPMGNQCVRQFSDHQAIMVTSGYPIIEEFATECEVKTRVALPVGDPGKDPKEKYSQTIQLKPFHKNPYGIILRPIKADNNLDFEGTLPLDIPSRRYITPDVNITKYSGDLWMQLRDKAAEDLNIGLTKMAQSGVAKEYDNETKYSMIGKICNNLFDNIMLNSVKFVDCYLNRKTLESSAVYINKPTTFSIKTEDDLINNIATLKKNDVPVMFLSEATEQLSRKMFSESPLAKKIFSIQSTYDPLFVRSVNEKTEMLMNAVITKEAYIKSELMWTMLKQLAEKMSIDKFIKTDNITLYKAFLAEVQQYMPNTTPSVNADGSINPQTEEAQANLRGSVGGVQGILQIQQSVQAGTTSRDSGMSILQIIFGFTEEEATNLLGNVKPAPGTGAPATTA